MDSGNYERLLQAEVIYEGDLPDEYREVVDGLTDDETDVLISVKQRLDAADVDRGAEPTPEGRPAFTTFFPY
jgi:hypothetical protein